MASENYSRLPQQLRDQNATKLEGFIQRMKVIAELREQFEAMKWFHSIMSTTRQNSVKKIYRTYD